MEPWDQFKQMFSFVWDKFDMAKTEKKLKSKLTLNWVKFQYV